MMNLMKLFIDIKQPRLTADTLKDIVVYPHNIKRNVRIEIINLFHCRRILLKTAKVTAPKAVVYRGYGNRLKSAKHHSSQNGAFIASDVPC